MKKFEKDGITVQAHSAQREAHYKELGYKEATKFNPPEKVYIEDRPKVALEASAKPAKKVKKSKKESSNG